MGNSGYTCIRRMFCSFNVLIWICGGGFLAIGVWLRFAAPGYATLLPDHAGLSADYVFMAIGAISFVIAFFGCCGSSVNSCWVHSRSYSAVESAGCWCTS